MARESTKGKAARKAPKTSPEGSENEGIKKQYLKSGACKVTFRLPKEAAAEANVVAVVGDFNDWSIEATPMKKQKNGDFTVTVELESGREYRYKYLIDGQTWENDWNADRYEQNAYGTDDSVIFTESPKINKIDRVRAHTAQNVLDDIDQGIRKRIQSYATQSEDAITRRIEELDKEWDIERYLEANASSLAFIGLVLGSSVNKKFLFLTGGVLLFLFQHAVQGWCPPVPLFRRLGIRTRREIDWEKFALKALRGDFDAISSEDDNFLHVDNILHKIKA